MKKCLLISVLSLILVISWGGEGFTQAKKEMTFSGTHYYGSTSKVFKLDQDQMIVNFEILGVRVNDNVEDPFHEASVHIVGIFYMGKDGARLRGYETWADKDGDKLIWEIREKKADDSPPGTLPGTGEVFSGTGKYVGMQGTMDYLVRYPKAFPDDTGRGICRENVKLVPAN